MEYGIITDIGIEHAPARLTIDSVEVQSPTHEQYLAAGYLPIQRDPEVEPRPWYTVKKEFETTENAIIVRYTTTPRPYEISKYKLAEELLDADLAVAFQMFLKSDPVAEFLWSAASAFDSDNATFQKLVTAFQHREGLDNEQITNILHKAAK